MNLFRYLIVFLFLFSAQHVLLADSNQDLMLKQSNEYTVKSVKRNVDLENQKFSFHVTLSNDYSFEVSATLEDLLAEKIYKDQLFVLVSEEFVDTKPWLSTFTYQSTDSTVQLQGQFDSINSHWHPSGLEKIVSITQKEGGLSGAQWYSNINFSDGSVVHSRSLYLNSEVGDKFFQAQLPTQDAHTSCKYRTCYTYYSVLYPTALVGVKDGRLIVGLYDDVKHTQFIPVTW